MEYKLIDLIDLSSFQTMLECLNKLTRFTSYILDNQGDILVSTDRRDICTKLQEGNLCSERECLLHKQFIPVNHENADSMQIYRCPNGMIVCVAPIAIEGNLLGSLFSGQIITEKPDVEHFRQLARQNGLQEDSFLDAFEKVPVMTIVELQANLPVIRSLASLIVSNGFVKLKEIETRKIILDLQHNISIILSKSNNLQQALNLVLEKVCKQSGLDCGGIYLIDPTSGEVSLTVHFGLSERFISENSYFGADSSNAAILRAGTPVFRSFTQIQQVKNSSLLQEQIRSLAIIPIMHENQAIAALNLASHHFDEVSEDTRLVLESIASNLGGAILRIKAENQVKESEEKYRMAFNTSPDSININAMDGTYVDVNQGFLNLTGYTREEIIGFSSLDLNIWVIPEDRERFVAELRRNGKIENLESVFRAKDGRLITALMSASMLQINGKSHILSITHDITNRKKIETELLGAKLKAEESDRLKTSFLANISHELRTPMNGILGFAELLEDDTLTNEERHEYISVINDSAHSLLGVITNIVDISKIDSGQLETRVRSFCLNDLLDELMRNFQSEKIIREKSHLKIEVVKALTDEQSVIHSDSSKIFHVFSLLLNNAAKFTDQGFIRFGYYAEGSHFRFFVSDTGKGIPKDKHHSIFEPFRQEEEILSRKYGGIGLGLSIAKGLVGMLGGKIRVESEPGKGSEFSFEIPLEIPELILS